MFTRKQEHVEEGNQGKQRCLPMQGVHKFDVTARKQRCQQQRHWFEYHMWMGYDH